MNYDYLVFNRLAIGMGASYLSASDDLGESASVAILPIYANFYLIPPQEHGFFVTGGPNIVLASQKLHKQSTTSQSGIFGSIGVGYEYRSRGGFMLRLTPYYLFGNGGSVAWIGLSIGGNL